MPHNNSIIALIASLTLFSVSLVSCSAVQPYPLYTCGSFTGDNVYYQVKIPLLLFSAKDYPVGCLRFYGNNIVIDGGGASIICNTANCAARGVVANATNAVITNFKLVGTSGLHAYGDKIVVNDVRIMTVHSNALEVQATSSVALRKNHIVNALDGGIRVQLNTNGDTNSSVIIEENFFVGVKNPISVESVNAGISNVAVLHNNVVDSMGQYVITVIGEENEHVVVSDNFVAAFSGDQGIVVEGNSINVFDNQLLDCELGAKSAQESSEDSQTYHVLYCDHNLPDNTTIMVEENSTITLPTLELHTSYKTPDSSVFFSNLSSAGKNWVQNILPYTNFLFSFLSRAAA